MKVFKYEVSIDGETWCEVKDTISFQNYPHDRTTHFDTSKGQSPELKETYRRLEEMTGKVVELEKELAKLKMSAMSAYAALQVSLGKR